MRPSIRFLAPVSVLLLFSFAGAAGLKLKESDPSPSGGTREELLRKGEILSEGGYAKKAVWGKMVGVVKAPPHKVWQIFIDSNEWRAHRFPTLIEARVVNEKVVSEVGDRQRVTDFFKVVGPAVYDIQATRRSGGSWTSYSFQYYDIPWPVANRWMIVRVSNDEAKASEGTYRAEWTQVAGNLKSVEGYLVLQPFQGNPRQTLLEYYALADPGSNIPRFLVKWGVERIMPGVIRAVRRAVAPPLSS